MSLSNQIQAAIAKVRRGELGEESEPSWTTYIVDPSDGTLWDLKPVMSLVRDVLPSTFTTGSGEAEAIRAGFETVKFSTRARRALGLRYGEALTDEAGDRIAPSGSAPTKTTVTTERYLRDPRVADAARSRAGGVCEGCAKAAPFMTADGTPFLEVHHVQPLSEGGPDTLDNVRALCPNCHRQAHLGAELPPLLR